jgi:hypothetical protein
LGDAGVPTPCFVLSWRGHIEFQNNPIPVNTVLRQKRERYWVIKKKAAICRQRFSVIHLSNGGLACEESFKNRARFPQWIKWVQQPTKTSDNQHPTDNHQYSTTRNPQQSWTTTSDTIQQTRIDTLDSLN